MKASIYNLSKEHLQQSLQLIADQDVSNTNLMIGFGSKEILNTSGLYDMFKSKFPSADIAFCSTAGEIYKQSVQDDSLVVSALQFDKTKTESHAVNIKDYGNTYAASIALSKSFTKEGLRFILVLSDGSLVNGSDLVKGMSSQLHKDVLITGGLAGDGPHFQSTLVGLNEQPTEGKIVAVGFYGSNIQVTHGSQGGWDIFGLEKRVTNSSSNILVELENQNALDLYKRYLGPEADKLPGSALLFPLSVIIPGSEKPVVRTILSINEEDKTMTFAGDIPVGSRVRFMKANFDRLTQAAGDAAAHAIIDNQKPQFSLLISCVGRKLVLGSKTVEEVKAVSKYYNPDTMAGFYSYGEISPFNEGGHCQLHNQTMTITSFYEN